MTGGEIGMIGNMGMQIINAQTEYSIAKTQAEMQASSRAHRQTMAKISETVQLNSMTQNEIQLQDATRRAGQALQLASMTDKANAEVNAAAAGVAGGSIQSTMNSLERSALNANAARMANYRSADIASQEKRQGIKLQTIFNRDISPITMPSPSMALLGLGKSLIDTYNENQPEGSKTSNALANWFTKE